MKIKMAIFLSLFIIGNLFSQKNVEIKEGKIEYLDGEIKTCFFKTKKDEIVQDFARIYISFSEEVEPTSYNMSKNDVKGIIIDDTTYYGFLKLNGYKALAVRLVDGEYELYKFFTGGSTINAHHGNIGTGSSPYNTTGALGGGTTFYTIVKDNEIVSKSGGKKDLNKLFGDCPEAKVFIDNYSIKYGRITDSHINTVNAYNESCAK